MRQQFRDLGCPVRIINGMPDHVHCLFLLNPQKTITDVMKQIKGSTSHFINKNQLIPERFSWQDGFAAFSVSESIKERVFHYIENQKQHHAKQSSMIEFEQFLKLYGLVIENQ
jgi:REP element-mobilizing transposase RayT